MKLFVGHDDNARDTPGGQEVVQQTTEQGPPADIEERFGPIERQGVKARRETRRQDDDLHDSDSRIRGRLIW